MSYQELKDLFEEEKLENKCCVCSESIEGCTVLITKCSHCVCFNCIAMVNDDKCPHCQTDLSQPGVFKLICDTIIGRCRRIKKRPSLSELLVANEMEDMCCVCYESFSGKNVVITVCKHMLCFSCFFKCQDVCPFCRRGLERNKWWGTVMAHGTESFEPDREHCGEQDCKEIMLLICKEMGVILVDIKEARKRFVKTDKIVMQRCLTIVAFLTLLKYISNPDKLGYIVREVISLWIDHIKGDCCNGWTDCKRKNFDTEYCIIEDAAHMIKALIEQLAIRGFI